MTKAVSALIATVILVAFTVSAAVIVTSFMTGVIKFQTASVSNQAVCAQKGALLIDTAMCTRVRDSSLVGYWKMDSVNGTNYTKDFSGYGNDGLLTNMNNTGNATSGPTIGKIGNALQFDGVDDYVDAGNAANLDITGAITIEAWVKRAGSAWQVIVGKPPFFTGGNDQIYYIGVTPSNVLIFEMSDGISSIPSIQTGNIPLNEWTHVVGSWDGTNMRTYINGQKVGGPTAFAGPIKSVPSTAVRISTTSTSYPFNGTIDEVRIYNRSLSADEILQHYQKGLEKFAVDGYFKTIKASVRNIGTTPLSNFTVFADINGRLYLNSTPLNGGLTLPAASEPLTLQANTYYDGPIRTLKVSVLNCPISMTLTNDSAVVGTC